MTRAMIVAVFTALLSVLVFNARPAAAEAPAFDPDQPFRESLSTHMLRSLLNRALDILEEHVQIDGTLPDPESKGDRRGRLELKLYPKGKSKSDEHVKAEGWFSHSPGSGWHDFHFRFKHPREHSSREYSSKDQPQPGETL
jgi:hypothetical protein